MITRSKYKGWRYLPLAALLILAAALLLLQDTIRTGVTNLNALVPEKAAPSSATYQAILYQHVLEENTRLSKLLGLLQDDVAAAGRVVARPPRTLYDTLLIAVTPGADVSPGDFVRFEGIEIGSVTNVTKGSVSVILFSSPGRTTEVTVGNPTAIVVMKGLGGGAFTFEVPSAVALVPGDLVTSAANSAVVAIVRSVQREEGSASVRVLASSPASLSDLDYVEFIRPY